MSLDDVTVVIHGDKRTYPKNLTKSSNLNDGLTHLWDLLCYGDIPVDKDLKTNDETVDALKDWIVDEGMTDELCALIGEHWDYNSSNCELEILDKEGDSEKLNKLKDKVFSTFASI